LLHLVFILLFFTSFLLSILPSNCKHFWMRIQNSMPYNLFHFHSFHFILSHCVFFLFFFTYFLLSALPLDCKCFQIRIQNSNNVPKSLMTIHAIGCSIKITQHLFLCKGD
jgi:hypothetical protein